MNLKRLGRMSGIIAAVAMLAMVLQGCGGDDNGSNISQDMYDALQAEANAAKADATAAKAAQAAAEADAMAAKAAQAAAEAAEAEAKAAETAAKSAEATAIAQAATAEAAKMAAEASAMEAKAAQATAEADAKAAMADATAAKAAQVAAETAKAVADSEAAAAKKAEADAMAAQATAEAAATAAMAAEAAAKAAQAEAVAEATAAKEAQATAMAEATAAKAAQATAEAAATAAKEAQVAAETAKAVADSEAAAAKKAEADAKAAQAKAEADAKEAMAAETAAKEAQATAEAAAKDAMAAETAAKEAQATAEANETAAKAAQATAEAAAKDAMAAQATAEAAETAAKAAQATAEAALAEANTKIADLQAQLDSKAGTTEGSEGRAAAKRIADAASASGIMGGVSIKSLSQAAFGTPSELTLQLASGAVLSSKTDTAAKAAPAIAGWTGSALEKDGPGAFTQHALVYSDIDPSVITFGQAYPYNVTAAGVASSADPSTHLDVEAAVGPATLADTAQTTATPIISLGNGEARATEVPQVVGLEHGLSTTGVTSRTLGTAATGQENKTIRGTLDGVPGVFSFPDDSGVTLMMQDDGTLVWYEGASDNTSENDGRVLFKADDITDLLTDRDYLAFGVWTQVPDTPTYANPGQTRAFAMGKAEGFDANEINTLQGSASYSGPAAGHYAVRAASDHMVTHGRFTATATIKASFDGTGSVRPVEANVVDLNGAAVANGFSATVGTTPGVAFSNSTISNFMDEDGNAMAGWLVNLGSPTMINNTGTTTSLANSVGQANITDAVSPANLIVTWGKMLSGATSGTTGSQAWSGVWDGSFHGTNTATTPTGIVGRFQAEVGTPRPITTPDGRINQFTDEGFAGVIGAFAGR